jgi:hypothetical protein
VGVAADWPEKEWKMKLYYNGRYQCSDGNEIEQRIRHICLWAKMVTQQEAEHLFALAMDALSSEDGVMRPGEIRLQSCRRFACGTNAGDPVYEGTFRITE